MIDCRQLGRWNCSAALRITEGLVFCLLLLHLCTTPFVFLSISQSPRSFLLVHLYISFSLSWCEQLLTFSLHKRLRARSILQTDEDRALGKYVYLWQQTGSWGIHQYKVYWPLCCVAGPFFVLKGQQSWVLASLTAMHFSFACTPSERTVCLYICLSHTNTHRFVRKMQVCAGELDDWLCWNSRIFNCPTLSPLL